MKEKVFKKEGGCGNGVQKTNSERGDGDKEEVKAKTKKVREDSSQEHRQAMKKNSKNEYVRSVEAEAGEW